VNFFLNFVYILNHPYLAATMSVSLFRRSLPLRFALKTVPGLNAPPVETGPPEETNTVPFIPREFAKDTIEFFRQSSPHIKSLLDLVFSSPGFKREDEISPEELEALEELKSIESEYQKNLALAREKYETHLSKARRSMFHAIQNLPEDMYDEAVKKGEMLPPESLQFHEMYREQLMAENLSDWEMVKFQTFSNLMHIRYSHSEAKKKHKERFFISESAALNLRKERAKQEKNLK
jgi:hypothetical protein